MADYNIMDNQIQAIPLHMIRYIHVALDLIMIFGLITFDPDLLPLQNYTFILSR